jgi:hypothetical protein
MGSQSLAFGIAACACNAGEASQFLLSFYDFGRQAGEAEPCLK